MPKKKRMNMLEYRARNMAKKQDISKSEAVALIKSENEKAKLQKKLRKKSDKIKKDRKHDSENNPYIYGDKVITSVVSGGGGPGSGKKR